MSDTILSDDVLLKLRTRLDNSLPLSPEGVNALFDTIAILKDRLAAKTSALPALPTSDGWTLPQTTKNPAPSDESEQGGGATRSGEAARYVSEALAHVRGLEDEFVTFHSNRTKNGTNNGLEDWPHEYLCFMLGLTEGTMAAMRNALEDAEALLTEFGE